MNFAAIHQMMKDNAFIRSHEMEIVRLEDGLCVGRMPFRKDQENHLGQMHGGISYAFADIIAGALAHTCGQPVTTTGGEIHYLAGIKDTDEILCTAKTVKQGRKLSVYEIRITDGTGGHLYAYGTFTYYTLNMSR